MKQDNRDNERAHRVGRGRYPRPIVCKLAHYKTKEDVIRAARYLRGTGVAVSEDHSRRVRKERAFLKDTSSMPENKELGQT